MKFKPNANATKRTKNRFSEHTVIPLSEETGPMSESFRLFANNVHGFEGRTCQSFCSVERDKKDPRYPRWFGWLPVDEIEEVKGE